MHPARGPIYNTPYVYFSFLSFYSLSLSFSDGLSQYLGEQYGLWSSQPLSWAHPPLGGNAGSIVYNSAGSIVYNSAGSVVYHSAGSVVYHSAGSVV